MMSVNKPNVRILMGNVNNTKIGRTIAFKIPNTNADINAM